MITMVITDLDKTLLRSDETISDYTVSVLKKCQANGIKVAFATARSTYAAKKFFKRFMPDIFIGYGGALVTNGEKIIHQFYIQPDIANQIIKECLATPEITRIHAINESIALSNYPEPDMEHYQYTDFTREFNNHYLKISFNTVNPDAAEKISSHFPMCDMLRYTGENLYKIADHNAVKWKAVKATADYYGLDTDTFLAFGDDINDLEMIQKCGTGVAVKNAVSEVKAAAKYICKSNDNDGVAKWIEEHLLKQ